MKKINTDGLRFDIENMVFYSPPTSAAIQGFELTPEWRVIGALVKRLGGRVEITPIELSNIQGVAGFNGYGGTMILTTE